MKPRRELTRDELEAETGSRQRACLCASWELAALGRCVCPRATEVTPGGVVPQGVSIRRPPTSEVAGSALSGAMSADLEQPDVHASGGRRWLEVSRAPATRAAVTRGFF